jgi:cleavage and polyadenylation specificity factor subunit 1
MNINNVITNEEIKNQKQDEIITFTPFNNELYKNSFIYMTKSLKFNIANLEQNFIYNFYYPFRRVNLGQTPKFIVHHNGMYIVTLSKEVELQVPDEVDESEVSLPNKQKRYPIFNQELHEIVMYDTEFKKTSSFEFDQNEYIIDMKKVTLERGDNNYYTLIAIGTGYVLSEDVGCKGRIILFDVEQYGNREIYTLDKISEKELKSPATAISEVDGWLLVAVGSKIYVYYFDWTAKQLVPASFYDSQFFVTSISSIKRYILYGDQFKSVHFIKWRKNKGNALKLLSKDFEPLCVVSTGFIVYEEQLGLIVSDLNNNIQIYSHSPKKTDSYGGKKLVVEADMHIGSEIKLFTRIPMKDKKNAQFSIFCTINGQIGSIIPLSENTHRRLLTLCSKLYTTIPHYAGLHPKSFRLFKNEKKFQRNIKKNIVDGQLLWRFVHLNTAQQKELTKEIGTTPEIIISNILDIQNNLNFF